MANDVASVKGCMDFLFRLAELNNRQLHMVQTFFKFCSLKFAGLLRERMGSGLSVRR